MAALLMEWNPATLATGINSVDQQHQKLIDLINRLHAAMLKGRSRDEAPAILNDLADYTVMHFKHEEDIFDRIGYADSVAHKKQHADLVAQVADLQDDAKAGKLAVGMETMEFLKSWLTDHIQGADFKYIDAMKAHNIA